MPRVFCFMRLSEAILKFNNWRSFKVRDTTIKGYDLILRQFCLFVRDCEIEEIQEEHVTEWFSMMFRLGWDRNSFIPKAMALKKFFEYLDLKNFQVLNPALIPVPAKDYKLPRIADEENYKKLLSIIPIKTNDGRHIRNLTIITMLWDSGARNGEVLSLNLEDLDLKEKRAVIKTEKSRGFRPIREIFWTEKTNENLKRWLDKREHLKKIMAYMDSEAVFVSIASSSKNNQSGHRFNMKGVGEMLRRYANRADIPYINAHAMRHRFGRELAKKDVNNSTISSLMGHASIQSSYIYTALFNRDSQEKYRKIMGK